MYNVRPFGGNPKLHIRRIFNTFFIFVCVTLVRVFTKVSLFSFCLFYFLYFLYSILLFSLLFFIRLKAELYFRVYAKTP